MDILKNFKPDGVFEENQKRIFELREQIHQMLVEMNFEIDEQNEVLKIIDEAQAKIREISKGLVGSNINKNPKKDTDKALKEIQKIIDSVPKNIKKQMEYIISMRKVMGEI